MSSDLVDAPSCAPRSVTRGMSQDSEYDDALEVPLDSLEITVDNNGEPIEVCRNKTERIADEGINFSSR